MPQTDIDRILKAIDKFGEQINDFGTNIALIDERQRNHGATIREHAAAIDALEKTRALTAELDTARSRIKVLEDNALVEQGKRKAWGVVAVAISTILGLVIKLL